VTPAPPNTTLTRAGLLTLGFNGAALVTNLLSGVLVARVLGPSGRGELAAIIVMPNLIGWVFALGCLQATSYHQARVPRDAARLLSTWGVLLVPMSVVTLVIGEIALPTLLGAQSAATVELGQLFFLTVVVVFVGELAFGVLLGDHDFTFYNIMRVAQPGLTAAGYLTLWALQALSVRSALAVTALMNTLPVAFAVTRVVRRHGIGRPDLALARSTLWYGLRVHGNTVSSLANARLDLMIMPAFLGASQVGLYSVATNVSWIVVVLAGALSVIVLPAAARPGARTDRTVILSLQATLIVGLVLALAVGLASGVLVEAVYGPGFGDSVAALLLLLPGSVLLAGSSILIAGLAARNRPLTSSGAQGLGLLITVPGLLLFLPHGGINAAALVSTVSYVVVFISSLAFYRRAAGLSWRQFASLEDLFLRARASFRAGTSLVKARLKRSLSPTE
jgi:O-antigen/teichoic acid export membrane protein